jgi:hypothetical protein
MPAATPLGRGLSRKVDRQFREAGLAATADERDTLRRLHELKEAGAIPMPEVSATLTALLRQQNERPSAHAA